MARKDQINRETKEGTVHVLQGSKIVFSMVGLFLPFTPFYICMLLLCCAFNLHVALVVLCF